MFGSLALLKRKATALDDAPPPSPANIPSHPPPFLPPTPTAPPCKQPRRDPAIVDWMWRVVKAGGQWLDELRAGQLAAHDAMIQQQAVMREVASWERELESAIRELVQWLQEEEEL